MSALPAKFLDTPIMTLFGLWAANIIALFLLYRCQHSLEAEDTALTSSLNDVINKCPREPSDYIRARYLACEYAVPTCRHHSALRPASLCPSHDLEAHQTAALDVVTSHTASRHSDANDDVSNDDNRRHLSTSRCHCGKQCHVTQFGTFSSPQIPVAPPT